MDAELQKLRIDHSDRAKRGERRRWPIVLVLLLLGGAAIGVWQWKVAADVVAVHVETVRLTDVSTASRETTLLDATGYVMAAHKIELASKVVGRVAWVGVEMGDAITAGQTLVRLEDDEYKARVAQQQGQLDMEKAKLAELEAGSRPQEIAAAQAKLDQIAAELASAELNLSRLKELQATNSISRQQFDDAEAIVFSRRAQVESQRQQYELTKIGPRKEQIDAQRASVRQIEGGLSMTVLDLANTIIKSPVAATVLERNVEVGEFVTTGFVGDRGAKGYVVSIADLNDLRIELDISQSNFAKVALGGPCRIVTDAYPDRRYEGVVDLISPEANRQKATVEVRVKVLNPDSLMKPDMNATVSFLAPRESTTKPGGATTQTKPTARIAATAVHDGAVFVIEDGRAVSRAVETVKVIGGKEVDVVRGLIGGEKLITDFPPGLRDGVRVLESK